MKEIHELKVGDKIELRDDLEDGEYYGDDAFVDGISHISYIEGFRDDERKMDIKESCYAVTPEMILKVNNKRVKFVNGFKYTIMEDEMIDPKSLVQSGNIVKIGGMNFIAIQHGGEIILTNFEGGHELRTVNKECIEKIIKINIPFFSLEEAFDFDEQIHLNSCSVVYNKNKETKEMTMEEVNKALGYKVKIVEGK